MFFCWIVVTLFVDEGDFADKSVHVPTHMQNRPTWFYVIKMWLSSSATQNSDLQQQGRGGENRRWLEQSRASWGLSAVCVQI